MPRIGILIVVPWFAQKALFLRIEHGFQTSTCKSAQCFRQVFILLKEEVKRACGGR